MPDANTVGTSTPSLGAGDAVIGRVKLTDGTNVLIWTTGIGADSAKNGLPNAPIVTKTLKSVSVSLSATGHAVPLVSNKRIKVYAVKLVCSAALTINFRDGASTALEGGMAIAANGGFVETVAPPNFLFQTAAGNDLDLVISGTGTVAGRISYWDDDAT